MDLNGTHLGGLVQQGIQHAAQQDARQAALLAAFQATMSEPHVTETLLVQAMAIKREDDRVTLMIALPYGRRIDIPLTADAIIALVAELGNDHVSGS